MGGTSDYIVEVTDDNPLDVEYYRPGRLTIHGNTVGTAV